MAADGARPGAAPMPRPRVLGPADWPVWRELRLRALQDSPEAFCATFAEESARSDEEWQALMHRPGVRWVLPWPSGGRAGTDQSAAAIAAAFGTSPDGPLEMCSVWVAPQVRGLGAGRLLVEAAVHEAAQAGRPAVQLWVRAANAAARRMYLSCGFLDTGTEHGQGPTRELLLSRATHLPG
jgi:ribosomal protein S18 acetylase RimI-like enzyme